MDAGVSEEGRVELLCKRMGRMWTDKVSRNMENSVITPKMKDGSLTLIGQLFQNPRINFHAFQQTMKKAWRMENVSFTPLDNGIFAITFSTVNDIKRVQEQGPWSFANHLLLLQSWKPNTTAVAYKFTSCIFWVHVMGVPFEWGTKELLKEIASDIGEVYESRMETKGMVTYGRVKVAMELNNPLRSGVLVCNGGRQVWLDFKYERLPKFCYLCGKIGHYMAECEEGDYGEEKLLKEEERLFGPWLKAEEAGRSPFWRTFYEEIPPVEMEEERVLNNEGQLVLYSDSRGESRSISGRSNPSRQHDSLLLGESDTEEEDWMRRRNGQCSMPVNCDDSGPSSSDGGVKKGKGCGKVTLPRKKVNRFCPYVCLKGSVNMGKEEQLLDVPVQMMEFSEKWALVASPNKPPGIL